MANTSFAQLKRNRQSQFEKLTTELTKMTTSGPTEDTRFWKPTLDKAGNGSAVIRFLPAPQNEDQAFIRYFEHAFKGPGGWYIEKSLTTFGEADPVSEYNSKLWNSGIDSQKEVARKQKRKLVFVANILVISDPGNRNNEGHVFLFKFGKKIFDKINDQMFPQFEDQKKVNPFDFWEGANFRLRVYKDGQYPNYDKSKFDEPSQISDIDDELEVLWKKQHPLMPLVDRSAFKSYDELKARMDKVLSAAKLDVPGETSRSRQAAQLAEDEEDFMNPLPTESAPRGRTLETKTADVEEEDESLDFYQKLARR
jgi:ElaB/YqjD/DUF883 family membrane-anchored ribosome-binding protein